MNTEGVWWDIYNYQVYERYDGANKMQIEPWQGIRYFAKRNETKWYFVKRYFAKRYFAKRYFAKRYFAKRYFAKWYFARPGTLRNGTL